MVYLNGFLPRRSITTKISVSVIGDKTKIKAMHKKRCFFKMPFLETLLGGVSADSGNDGGDRYRRCSTVIKLIRKKGRF